MVFQSCARTDTAEGGGGLGAGCKEDIVYPSSVMVEETPGDGWDRGVGDGLQGDSWQAGEIGEVREMVFG